MNNILKVVNSNKNKILEGNAKLLDDQKKYSGFLNEDFPFGPLRSKRVF